MQSTIRIGDHHIGQWWCRCSWQSTIGPHGLLLWPGTLDVILHHGFLTTHLWKTKPLDGTVTLLASSSLVHSVAYTKYAVLRTLHRKTSALFLRQVNFRAHKLLLPIAQSPIRLIVLRSSTPSLTRCLSCGTWAPAKSGGDCWRNLHVPLGNVWTQCFCCCFCNQQHRLSCGTTMSTLLPAMTTQRSLTDTFVVMAVAERTVSLQVLWCFIAIVRGCNWRNWFYPERIGTFTIVKEGGPVAHCGKGLVVALHGVRGSKALCGERLIVVLHDIHGKLPLWQGDCCLSLQQMWPPWRACHTCPWWCPHCLWRTHFTHFWWRTRLWWLTHHL